MFSKRIFTALAISLAATAAQANEHNAHESRHWLEDRAPRPADAIQLPVYIVLSGQDRARAELTRDDFTTVTIAGHGSLHEEPFSGGDL
ncbi:hypothetical protein PVT71_29205 (plasmid) [Salipiger sp. H15]|uniref:Uncharacterized protein n=1 Tax=Alloyangia sp. H15 TaxID=3029062 RepID=A0AAU8ATU2_9RHOB